MDQKLLFIIIIFFSLTNSYPDVISKIFIGLFYLIIILYLIKNIYPDFHKSIIKLLISILEENYFLSEIASFILSLFYIKPEKRYKFSKKPNSQSQNINSGSANASNFRNGIKINSANTNNEDKYTHYNLMNSSVNYLINRGQTEETLKGSINFIPREE
jgi:uncharacterized protein (UPF0332 family)